MQTERVKSNIMVTVPDFSAPIAQALEAYNKQQLEDGKLPAASMDSLPTGYILTKQGMFVINHEGVGDSKPITPENKFELDLWPQWEDGSAALPEASIQFSDTELIMLPTLKEVPLEDFIRTFGRRLESNYNVWLHALREAEVMTMESST